MRDSTGSFVAMSFSKASTRLASDSKVKSFIAVSSRYAKSPLPFYFARSNSWNRPFGISVSRPHFSGYLVGQRKERGGSAPALLFNPRPQAFGLGGAVFRAAVKTVGGGVAVPLPRWGMPPRLVSTALWMASIACLATFSVNSFRSVLPG